MDIFNNLETTNQDDEKKKRLQQQIDARKNKQYENNPDQLQMDPANNQEYQVEIDPIAFANYNRNVIANSENPEEEKNRFLCATEIAKELGKPVTEVMDNLDDYINALYSKQDARLTPENSPFPTYRNAFVAIKDNYILGKNTLKQGEIGNKLMQAELDGDEGYAKRLLEEYNTYEEDNKLRQDNAKRSWITDMFKVAANSVPFTVNTGAAGLAGSLISPAAGNAAGFLYSQNITNGQVYAELRNKGVTPSTARKVAALSGSIQAAIEVGLGTVSETLAAGSRIAGTGTKAAAALVKGSDIIEKVTYDNLTGKLANTLTEVGKKAFHYGTGTQAVVNWLLRYGFNTAGEGIEELSQSITEDLMENWAYSLDKLNVPKHEADEIIAKAAESFKGGIQGALILGAVPSAINAKATAQNYQDMRKAATDIESEAMFMAEQSDNPVVSELNDVQKYQYLHDVFEEAQADKNAAETKTAEEIAEVNKIEGNEPAPVDENGDPIDTPAYREEGKIYTTDNVISVDGQKSTNEYIVGDPSKESENSYGSIQYEMDEDNQTVTITSFDMAPHRENLRNEVFNKFAQEHSNFDIKWETTGARAEEIKNNLIALNPSGKNNGLNYYSSEEQNIEARKEIDSQVKQFMPKITDEQRPFVVSFMESLARKTPGRDINNFLNTVFQNRQIFGDIKEGEQIANKEGYSLIGNPSYKESNGMTTNVRFTKDIKKVIYAGEHGDFTTFCHELIHAAQPFFDQETEAEAERLFNVQNGDWNNSTYNYVDPNGIERTITSAEALTYAAEDYFNTGYVQNEEARTLMQKIAKIFVDLYDACKRHLTLTPEIRAFYDKLFNADNSVLAAAEKSLQQEIKEEQDQTVNQDEELLNNQREATELYFKDRANLGYSREEALRELENNEMNKANLYYQNKEIVQEMADKYFPDNSISQEEIDALLDGINIDQFEQTEEDIRDNIENFKADEALNQDLKNILADSSLTPEQQQEYFDKITDPNATLTDQERAVLEAAGIDANNIRYDALMQSKENKENPELWQKKIKTAENYLTTDYYSEKDILRISKNLKIFKDSAWYNQAIETLLLRGDIEDLVNEREAKGLSLLYRDDMKTQLEACKQGVEGIAAYLEATGIIGSNDKCVHSVNGSFINCNPSKLCAEFCYAANGSFTWPAPSVKSELVSWYIDKNPIAAAQMVAKHYKTRKETRLEFTSGKALRLLDKGELSENWIQFVKELNHNDIHTTIFSKRPELLRQIDSHYNVIMISSDWTNRAIAMREENLNLPMAYVYQGLDGEIEYLEANKERYLKYGGSILPVRDKNKNEGAKYIDKLPEWTKDYLCPIDSGEVTTKEHDCLICNSAGGIGCYYHRVTIAEKYIDDSPLDTWEKEKLHASIRTIESQVDEAVRRGESEELEILLSSMANLVNKIQSGLIERDYSERVKRDGEFPQRTSRASEGIGSGESKPNFQAIGELGATTLDRLQEVNTRIDNLDVAKKMETSGKDPLAVKIATGWERGADGKWRYEIPDLELADYDTIYKNIIGYPGIQKKAISLKNIIKADELFKAYPDLKDIDVLFDSDIEKGTAGQWESDRNIIRMKYDYLEEISKDAVNIIEDDETGEEEIEDLRNPQYIKSTLIHEIQHAIQDREGFARGGSPSEFESFMSKEEVENFKSILKQEGAQKQKKAAELLMQINKDINTDKLLKDYMSEIQAGKATLDQYFDELVKRQKSHQLWNEYNTLSQDADKSLQKAQRLGMYETNEGEIITPFEAYRRLAGEVEARNVQYRQYLTDEQRRNRLLEQTEDVSRDQQIVLYNAMKMASMDADPVEMEKIAIRRQYEGTENWLKAPNGENTNLTEKQWIEVRTSNFKNFFGDWQNDPENASKVLDENGEPLVVYHGTDKDFDVFDATKSRANMDIQGNFFSPWNIDAQGYGPNVRAFYLSIKNPAKEQVGYKALHTFTGQNEAGIKARELLKQQGYDGVNNSDEEYITFNANQIKSATDNNGKYDVNNDNVLFQTEDELYRDARNYASWEDFMDAYTSDFDPDAFMDPEYHSQVPSQADAAWYKKVWQFAQQRKEESFNQQEQRETKIKTDDQDAVDKQFYSDLVADPTMLDHFLHNVGLVKAQDFNSEAYANPESEEEYNEIQELAALQSYMNTKLSNPLWTTNAQRVAKGISITPTSRQQLLTMIRGSERAYREIYSRVMQDDTYAVPEEQSIVKNLEKKAKKYKLISKNDDLETRSPEELRKLADEISNREIADEIRSGQLKLDDRLDKYINSLTTQVTDQQKKMDDLKKTIDDDYQRISDWESRQLLKAYDEMLETRLKYNNNTDLMSEKLRKGLIITSKYQLDNRKLKATYDEVFKKFKDLEKSMQINAETREALNRREEYFFLKEAVARKQREANAAREVKKIRVQLVKRVMRKVPLDRVDYDTARTIIAIQKVFEPNLLGGVNKWIGQEKPYLVTVATAWLTDEEEKQRLTRYLSNGGKAAHQLLAKLETLQKVEDLNEWTAKELQSALRVLPKENWIKDLHLDELAEQRDEDINLGITQDFNYKWVYLPNNDSEYNTSIKAQIKEWHAVFPKDVEQMIKDAIGDILYNDLINKPMAEWSTEEMTLLAQKVNDLYKMGRDVLAAKKQAQIEAADAIRQQIEKALNDTGITIKDDDSDEVKAAKQKKIDDILGNNAALKGTLNDEGESRINRLLHGYADANIRRVTRIMDNYQEGINTNELYWKEDAAYTEEVNQKRARSEKINEALKKYNIGFNELYEKHTIENFYKGESISLTTDELLYFAKAAEDEQSKEAVMYGNMFSAANMQKYKERFLTMDELAAESEYQPNEDGQAYGPGTMMFMDVCGELFTRVLEEAEKLDKKFYQFADAIAADYEEQYVRLNKASIEQFNQPVRRVEKYVPLIRLESNGDTNENKVMQDCLAINGLGKQWVDKGMTQKRITMSPLYQKPVQTGLYKTWLDSVDRTEHFIAYSPLVRELNRVYKSRDAQFTRQFIQNRYGKGMLSYIDEYINELANPTANRVRSASDEFFKALRGRTAPAYLSWKVSSIIKQGLTSPWPYMQFVDPAHYIAAVFKNIGTKGAIFDLIKEKSPYMRERVMDPMNDLVREMEQQAKNPFTAAYFKASATGMAGLEWIDWVCVAPGWYACYQKEYNRLQNENAKLYQDEKTRLLKANEEADFDNQLSQQQIEAAATAKQLNEAQIEKYAVRYADDVTRQCQPSNRSVDIAPLFKNSSEFAKAYLQFQTSLNVIWQNLRYDIPAAAKNKDFMRITGMVTGYVFAGILMNAVVGGVGDGDDKDKKDEVKDLIWYATTQFSDSVPMIGSELTNMLEKIITGKGSFIGNTDMTPLVSKATRAIQNTAAAIRADPEDKNQAWFKAARSYADAVEMYFGAPVQGIKEVEKLVGVGDGDGKMDISLDNIADVYGIVNNIKPKDK